MSSPCVFQAVKNLQRLLNFHNAFCVASNIFCTRKNIFGRKNVLDSGTSNGNKKKLCSVGMKRQLSLSEDWWDITKRHLASQLPQMEDGALCRIKHSKFGCSEKEMPSFYVICPWGVFLSWSQGVWFFKVVLCLLLLALPLSLFHSFCRFLLLLLFVSLDPSPVTVCVLFFALLLLLPLLLFLLLQLSVAECWVTVNRSHSFSSPPSLPPDGP